MLLNNYDTARNIIEKYSRQNESLFFNQKAFFAFSVKDDKTLRKLYNKYKTKTRKCLTLETYLFLIDFLETNNSEISVDELIFKQSCSKQRNINIIYLLNAIKSNLSNNFQESNSYCKKIAEDFRYPIINEIIDVIYKKQSDIKPKQ